MSARRGRVRGWEKARVESALALEFVCVNVVGGAGAGEVGWVMGGGGGGVRARKYIFLCVSLFQCGVGVGG